MDIMKFDLWNKLKKIQFFQGIFLLANINIEVFLKILFLIFSRIDIQFAKKKFI